MAAAAPAPFRPKGCIAIDFGTAATGYCMAIAGDSPTSTRVLPFKPGDRASQATEKNLTAILLEASTMNPVAIGREARRRFFELDAEEMKKCVFFRDAAASASIS